MSRVPAVLGISAALIGSAYADPGGKHHPLESPVNLTEPWDNAGQPVSERPRRWVDGANRLRVDPGPAADRLTLYVAGPDGRGYFAHPVHSGVPGLGKGVYWIGAAYGSAHREPGRPPHFDHGPVRLVFRARTGGTRWLRLLPLPPP